MDMHSDQPGRAILLGATATEKDVFPLAPLTQTLKRLGFECVYPEALPPSSFDPGAAEHLRAYLEPFARENPGGLVHPGISSWNEHSDFAGVCLALGLNPVAPSSRVLSTFANQLLLLQEANQLKIPHLALDFESIGVVGFHAKMRELEERMRDHHGPFVLKSVHPRVPANYFVVQRREDTLEPLQLWMEQLNANAGDTIVFAEKYLESSRYLSLPFARFNDGSCEFFSEIDASLRDRQGKLIELSPPTHLHSIMRTQLRKWTQKLLDSLHFVGVGSVQFLIDGETPYLISGRSGLDDDYDLWESVSGISALEWQIACIRYGSRADFSQKTEPSSRVFLKTHIKAMDPLLHLPQAGVIDAIRAVPLPSLATEVRCQVHVHEGERFPREIQEIPGILSRQTIAEVIVNSTDIRKLIQATRRALSQLWFSGTIQTNERFISELLEHPFIEKFAFHTGFLEEEFLPAFHPAQELRKIAAMLGHAWKEGLLPVLDVSLRVSASQKWIVSNFPLEISTEDEFTWGEVQVAPNHWVGEIQQAGKTFPFGIHRLNPQAARAEWVVRVGVAFFVVKEIAEPARAPDKDAERDQKKIRKLRALITGRVYALLFRAGTRVPAHDRVVLLESMGVLVPHGLPMTATLVKWHVGPEQEVVIGQELADVEI